MTAGSLSILLLGALALAGEGEPRDVTVQVRGDVVVNWTRLVVEASGEAWGRGVASSRSAVEHQASRQLGPGVLDGALGVQVAAGITVEDLQQEQRFGGPINNRITRWAVTEARYHASGKVELVGELALAELLKPWTLERAREAPVGARQTRFTGVVIDARGLGAQLAFAPYVLAPDGGVLYDSVLWEDARPEVVPVIYVSDPAHPAAVRAGASPLFVRAESATGPDLTLTTDDAIRFRTGMQSARVLGEGTVVVVVDR